MAEFALQTRKACKMRKQFIHANRKVLLDPLDIATGMLKAITATGTFVMIGQVVLLIGDQPILHCNSLPVHLQ